MLGAGAGVLLEKPLCTTLAEADDLVAVAAAHGERILYGENLAYAPVVAALLERARTIGPLEHVEVRALQGIPTWGAFLTDEWGGGALFDLGVHPLAVALLLALPGRATSVVAHLTGGEGHRTDVHAEVDLTFDTGVTAHVVSSWSAGPDSVWDAQASSATGVVRADLLPEPALEVDGSPVALRPVDAKLGVLEQYGYVGQLRALVADLAGQRQPFMSVAFGRLELDVVCAAYQSARTGEPESLPFTGRRDLTPLQLWRDA
jgi:predicted dehydrogenase